MRYTGRVEPQIIMIPAGTFLMGSEDGATDEKPVHEIRINPFGLGKFTVTNEEFLHFLSETNHDFNNRYLQDLNFCHPSQPVVGVSWYDSEAYCRWLRENTEKSYRLPTEAEWEYAACGGNPQNSFPWGTRSWDEWPELRNRFKNGPEQVGSFAPNTFGLHDMGMNVHEWCSDWYDAVYYRNSPPVDPLGAETGSRKSSRGGSWRHQIKITRCAARSSIPPSYRYADYGFRLALSR